MVIIPNTLRIYYVTPVTDTVFEIGDGYNVETDEVQLSWICEVFVNHHPDWNFFFGVQSVTTDVFDDAVAWGDSGE